MIKLRSTTIKMLALGLVVLAVALPVAWASELRPISLSELPSKAQEFIKKHFASHTAELTLYEHELLEKNYVVHLSKGTKVEFNGRGQWVDIESYGADIPLGILPNNLISHLKQVHPGVKIVGLERKSRRFVVELQNDVELHYDLSGKFLRYDD